jgi:hypothetical protein
MRFAARAPTQAAAIEWLARPLLPARAMFKITIRFASDGRGHASSGFAVTGSRFHVLDEDAPTVEAWARELAAVALTHASTAPSQAPAAFQRTG